MKPDATLPVLIAGGGLVGLTLALDLARRGVRAVVLDQAAGVAEGSRAICFAKRTLEIFARLGLGARMLEKGITWNQGRVFFQAREIYGFNLLPEDGHEFPAFVNLQQYHVEAWLVEACLAAGVDIRWRNRVIGVENGADVRVSVAGPEGAYTLCADWLVACDGARSFVRGALGLDFLGQVFRDRFLIADVKMQADFPTERWFWFDPPFHRNQSVLLHKQPDDVWRIDFQLGWEADPEVERAPERVRARIRAMLGEDVDFSLEWVSIYTFRCRRLHRFVHGRTIFAGDAAHQLSPFGARGGNSGVQDADNLGWKLAAVLAGAPASLLESYDIERIAAADENILHATRSTDFITPKSAAARAYRDAVLALAERFPFARPLVNSGRLSRPAVLADSPLNDPDADDWPGAPPLGSVAVDAPIGADDWLLRHLGDGFTLLIFGPPMPLDAIPLRCLFIAPAPVAGRADVLHDRAGLAARRYGAPCGYCVLLRPDQHVLSRFARFDAARVASAMARVLAGVRIEAVA